MKKYKLIFIFLYYFFSGLHFRNQPDMHHRPLTSFSLLSQIYSQQPKPAKPNSVATAVSSPHVSSPHVSSPHGEKQKIKIIIVTKKTSAAPPPTSSAPMSHVPVPPAPASPSPVSPRTRKIKIIIKKQPKKDEEQPQTFINDIAPPTSMIYNPCSDYIVPPPKCCRFFIDNRHCFLRSTDNACIDPITKKVFGFWNCEIGKKSELLPPPTDDVLHHDDHDSCDANLVQLDNNDDDDCNKKTALEMRKKSDANRARFTGQPLALLRQKIATKYGMQSFNSLGNHR